MGGLRWKIQSNFSPVESNALLSEDGDGEGRRRSEIREKKGGAEWKTPHNGGNLMRCSVRWNKLFPGRNIYKKREGNKSFSRRVIRIVLKNHATI